MKNKNLSRSYLSVAEHVELWEVRNKFTAGELAKKFKINPYTVMRKVRVMEDCILLGKPIPPHKHTQLAEAIEFVLSEKRLNEDIARPRVKATREEIEAIKDQTMILTLKVIAGKIQIVDIKY